MARNQETLANLETCQRCDTVLEEKAERCSSCGSPTKYMSFKTRAEYEVEQWRRHKSEVAASN